MDIHHNTITVDGLTTGYLEAGPAGGGAGTVVLLHGGEFGASAEIGWEKTIPVLAERYRVLAPDQLGYGHTAKVLDFVDGRGMRIGHVAAFCRRLGVESAAFVGNSMGAINLLVDTTSDSPLLPVRAMVTICGGGEIQAGEHMSALYDYDATFEAMRRIVTALFSDPAISADDAYVQRRHESATLPGAWEAIAAARFRRPGTPPPAAASSARRYDRITVPTLVVEGGADKLLPRGWAAEIAGQITGAKSAVVDNAGHCPQLEQAEAVNKLLMDFFDEQRENA
jgi:2-hydroxymuconate-semialdehyde hydrolase